MKKLLIAVAAVGALLAATACGNSKLTDEQNVNYRLNDSLQDALNNADSMFSILYDVTTGLEQIARLEHLLNANVNTESIDRRHDIEAQMVAIQQGLIQRRKRIAELEARLGQNAGENSKLRKQISALRSQIDEQAAAVADLTNRLTAANFRIEVLADSVIDLQATVDTIAAAKAQAESERNIAVDNLHAVYYVIGSNSELKNHNFISGGGFLRKTKVLEGDFDQSYMTRGDRRSLVNIPLDAPKAKVLTRQPDDSYSLERGSNDMLTLVITDPAKFWAVSNLLVIETKN
ncbi:MAG: hypothetical protein K2I28_00865 [Muribaculaceae bacterium]|nr:hypothetical protein [Muribaculaceae bacterium]